MLNSYNAGEFGTANGGPGGAYTPYSPPPTYDLGRWDDLNNAYGTYNFAGATSGYYVTKHQPVAGAGMFPHSGNYMLAVRNTGYDSLSKPAKPLDFSYKLDQRDFYNGGSPINPMNTGGSIVKWSIWAGPGPRVNPADGIWLSFLDSSDTIGFQFGWNETYTLRYRDTPSSAWISTGYAFGRPWKFGGPSVIYDRFDFTLDLLKDIWSLDVFSTVGGNTTNFVNGRSFGNAMQNFTEIDWHVGYGNEKSFFDDSSFTISPAQVPEPGTCALMALGCVLLWRVDTGRRVRKTAALRSVA